MRVAIGLLLVASLMPVAYAKDIYGQPLRPGKQFQALPQSASAVQTPSEPTRIHIAPQPVPEGFPTFWTERMDKVIDGQNVEAELANLVNDETHWVAPRSPLTIEVQKLIEGFNKAPVLTLLTLIDIVQIDGDSVLVAIDQEQNVFNLSYDDDSVAGLISKMHEVPELRILVRCLLRDVQTEYSGNRRKLTIRGQATERADLVTVSGRYLTVESAVRSNGPPITSTPTPPATIPSYPQPFIPIPTSPTAPHVE